MGKDQTTTPGTSCPTLYDECVGSLTSPADHNSRDKGDGAYGVQERQYGRAGIGVGREIELSSVSLKTE